MKYICGIKPFKVEISVSKPPKVETSGWLKMGEDSEREEEKGVADNMQILPKIYKSLKVLMEQ